MQKLTFSLSALKAGLAGVATIGTGTLIYALENSVDAKAADFQVHAYPLPWSHKYPHQALDAASVRRGYEVYKQVCSACHALKWMRWLHFVNGFMSKDEAKAEASTWTIEEEPFDEFTVRITDDKGNYIKRPATYNDYFPLPYPNKKAAEAALGKEPPNLTLMVLAAHGGQDYIFSLLTSYFDPPAGVTIDEGQAYNPYFQGGVIAMPQQLFDEGIEYEDGTPATVAQQAKDLVTFLNYTKEPFHDVRKRWGWKIAVVIPLLGFVLVYAKRRVWTFIKSQQFSYKTMKGREWTPESSSEPPNPSIKSRNPPKMKTDE